MNTFSNNFPLDKLFLIILGTFLLSNQQYHEDQLIFILLPIVLNILSAIISQPKLSMIELLILLLLSSFWPEYLYFVFLCFYDACFAPTSSILIIDFFALILGLLTISPYSPITNIYILSICFLSVYFGTNNKKQKQIIDEYQQFKNKQFETTYLLKNEASSLVKEQDKAIALEVSNERNRIARDIHDTVGHLLSSSLLQIGAIQTINQQKNLSPLLEQLHHTLHEGMDNIRDSIHNLHEESLNLTHSLDKILHSFTFCEIRLVGDIPENIHKIYKLTYIMLIKEALANVMKHSNATCVTITFQTHPSFYKLSIDDNGTLYSKKTPVETGIGLAGMNERITKLKGLLTIKQTETGFRLLTTLPRKGV